MTAVNIKTQSANHKKKKQEKLTFIIRKIKQCYLNYEEYHQKMLISHNGK